jgi:hypothetical protein
VVPPAWLAVTEHSPADTSVSWSPDTVQALGVLDLYVTGNPDVVVALSVTGPANNVAPPG